MNSIIIGSGRSSLEYKLGDKIDSFDNIIRFKGFETQYKKFSENLGEKITHLYCNTSKIAINSFYNLYKNDFFEKEFNLNKFTMTIFHKDFLKFKYYIELTKIQKKTDIFDFSEPINVVNRMKKLTGLDITKLNYTSGLHAIMSTLCDNIDTDNETYIHGFDAIDKNYKHNNDFSHYYEDKKTGISDHHNMSYEKKIIKYLINNNFLKTLV
tara:strand:+ start:7975 stop:8607 length:633 start_codon:yes stop_codon:yes gene_type:complete